MSINIAEELKKKYNVKGHNIAEVLSNASSAKGHNIGDVIKNGTQVSAPEAPLPDAGALNPSDDNNV